MDKEQLAVIANNISEAIALFNNNMQLVFVNEAALKIFELNLSNIKDKNYIEIIDYLSANELLLPSYNMLLKNEFLKLFSINNNDTFLKKIRLFNGKTIQITAKNQNNMLLLSFNDITNNLYLERKINSIHLIYKGALSFFSEGIILLGMNYKINFMNQSVNKIFDESENFDYSNKNIKDFFKTDLFKQESDLKEFMSNIIISSEQRLNKSGTLVIKSGKSINYSCFPIPEGLTLIKIVDISKYKILENELQQALDKVNQLVNSKSKLFITIADEYTAPLNSISSFAEILEKQYFGSLNSKQMEYCRAIIKSSNHLQNIVEAINELAKIQTDKFILEFEEVNLKKFILDVLYPFEFIKRDHNIAINYSGENGDVNVYIDKNALRIALKHVILNSISTISKSGIINIKSEHDNSKYFSITVTDNGEPIQISKFNKIQNDFGDSFQIGQLNIEELNYVLAIQVAKMHKGSFKAYSKDGNGTTVKFLLPIKQLLA